MLAGKTGILKFLFRAYPVHFTSVTLGLAIAGFLEGLTAAAFLPLISGMTQQDLSSGPAGDFIAWVSTAFSLTLTLPVLLSAIVVIMLARAGLLLGVYAQSARAASHVASDLRLRYLDATVNAAWPYFVSQKSGNSVNALGTESMRTIYAFRSSCSFIASVMQVAVYTGLAFFVSWQMTIAAIIAGAAVMGLLAFLVRMGRDSGVQQTELYNDVLSRLTDLLQGLKPIKAMGRTSEMLDLARRDVMLLKASQFRAEFSDQTLRILSEFLIVAIVAAGLYGLSHFSTLATAEILFMAFVFLRLAMRLSAAQKYYHNIVSSESALYSIQDKIDALERHAESTLPAQVAPSLQQGIFFRNVSFGYGDTLVLDRLDMNIPARRLTALYGPSGTGKTTVIDLVCGLIQAQGGQIMIDDADIKSIDRAAWRAMIGYLPQDTVLLHDTVRNNMTLGQGGIPDADLMEALRLAGAEDFVDSLSQGLDTMAGERGAKFSGGQRQRIALARALIRKPSLLILDEATSALDHETEDSILKSIRNLTDRMTIIMVTHSMAVKNYADCFIEMTSANEKVKATGS